MAAWIRTLTAHLVTESMSLAILSHRMNSSMRKIKDAALFSDARLKETPFSACSNIYNGLDWENDENEERKQKLFNIHFCG